MPFQLVNDSTIEASVGSHDEDEEDERRDADHQGQGELVPAGQQAVSPPAAAGRRSPRRTAAVGRHGRSMVRLTRRQDRPRQASESQNAWMLSR